MPDLKRITKSNLSNLGFSSEMSEEIIRIADGFNDTGIKSFIHQRVAPNFTFSYGEGDRHYAMNMFGEYQEMEVIANHNIGVAPSAALTYKVGGRFRLPIGTVLITIYYLEKFRMKIYIVEELAETKIEGDKPIVEKQLGELPELELVQAKITKIDPLPGVEETTVQLELPKLKRRRQPRKLPAPAKVEEKVVTPVQITQTSNGKKKVVNSPDGVNALIDEVSVVGLGENDGKEFKCSLRLGGRKWITLWGASFKENLGVSSGQFHKDTGLWNKSTHWKISEYSLEIILEIV